MLIEILYGEICNLFGDGQNAEYLRQTLPDADFVYTELNDTPRFVSERPDMILIGSMTESIQRRVIELLRPHTARIAELADDGVVFLATGNSGEIFTKHIEYVTEKLETDGLGLFDLTVKTDLFRRYNGKLMTNVDGIDVIGFRSQFGFIYGDNSACAFGENTRSIGINPDTKLEGMRRKNLICTSAIGPLLPLNPLFTEYLCKLAGADVTAAHREAAMEAYQNRLAEFKDPKLNF